MHIAGKPDQKDLQTINIRCTVSYNICCQCSCHSYKTTYFGTYCRWIKNLAYFTQGCGLLI